MDQPLQLWDYRRRVETIYRQVRHDGAHRESWIRWRSDRDQLFATHPQTPIDNPATFHGLEYFEYDPAFNTQGKFIAATKTTWGDFTRVGQLSFSLASQQHALPVFWLDSYGGGVFVAFRDLTNGEVTYGGGRYLLDTAKGADLGSDHNDVVLDFNFSYHPSCVHSDRWVCPLPPPDASLDIAVSAGVRLT